MRRSRLAQDDNTVIRARPVPDLASAALPPHLHPIVRRVLASRAVEPGQLAPGLAQLLPVASLPGVGEAAERLVHARAAGERVMVVGDFDADGATASALMVSCLRAFGFRDPAFLVPDRIVYGYGLSPGIVELAARSVPDLLVTVDNGITSIEGVQRARELGLEVIITDHHLAGDRLPGDSIIVSPSLPGTAFGSRALCGAGVAFYVMAATGRLLAEQGLVAADVARDAVTNCLDLVALGTVADLVPLDFNNRILVSEGIRRIRAGRSRPGIRALFQIAGRDPAIARSADLGFSIAPRLNAAGRLDDMSIGIECLLSQDAASAAALASRLDALNAERRALQARMEAEAHELLADVSVDGLAGGACLFDERWHPGIVGLVASRIREMTRLPAIAFARVEGGILRGSARSSEGFHVRDCIASALISLPGAPVRFGGHAMAAGLTLAEDDLPAFSRAFAAELQRQRPNGADADTVWTDGSLAPEDLGLELAEALGAAGPWGQGFPEPVFDDCFRILEQRVVGGKHLKLRVQQADGGPALDAIAFGQPPVEADAGPLRFLYRLDVNVWRNARSAQLVVERLA